MIHRNTDRAVQALGRTNVPRWSTIVLPAVAFALLVAWTGCEKPDTGPKRQDHAAAHTVRYHPDVKRATPNAASSHPASVSGSVTQPADIDFDSRPAGCPILFVNGESLTVQDVLEPILDELKEKAQKLNVPAYRNDLFREVGNQIDYQISLLVIYQEAKTAFSDEKIKEAFDKEADRMVKNVINRRYGGVEARYEAHLKSLDLSMADIKSRAKRQAMVMQFLRDRFRPMVSEPSRRELMTYYHGHPAEFTTPAKAELFLIEVPLAVECAKPLTEATPAEITAARERARGHLQRAQEELASGVEFAAVAKKYCKGVRGKTGGAWGEITPGSLTGRWAKAAEVLFTLTPHQTSGIIETDEALFIVRCGESSPSRTLVFEAAQEQIINRLMDEDFDRRRNAYVQELRSRATIRKQQEFFQAVLAASPRPPSLLTKPPQ